MPDRDYHPVVGEAIHIVIGGLQPFVERVMARALPPGVEWTEVIRLKDVANNRRGGEYRPNDLSLMLRAMTERLGDYGYPFSNHMSRQAQTYASELRDIRNRWAHTEFFSAPDAYRAIDTIELLLRAIGAEPEAAQVAQLKPRVVPIAGPGAGSGKPTGAQPAGAPNGCGSASAPSAATSPKPPKPSAPQPSQAGAPRIEIEAVTELSYPMAHCGIPVIEHITVEPAGNDIRSAVLEVDVVSAHGSHGGPQQIFLDVAANRPTIVRDVDLKLDPAAMLQVSDQCPGSLRAVLRNAAGEVLAEASKDVNILAANQWKATPLQLALEMLATHVQPNSIAVNALMVEVSDRLQSLTGNSAIDGYQSENPERVDAIAQAVFEAMQGRDIRYSEPPASWGDDGQKIRTPAEVLEGRLGTCLDTTLTMAAVLEQAGINATIWVLNGHAFLGYWRRDAALGSVSTTEVVDVVNQVELGNIRLVETTMVTQPDAAFADATNAPRTRYLTGDLTEILGVTDIRQARFGRIYPLPSREKDADGNTVVTQYTPPEAPTIEVSVTGAGGQRSGDGEPVPARIRQWKNALLDLSLRNKLINYTERSGYRVEVPGPALGRFEDIVNAGVTINLLASDAVKSVDRARGIRYGRDLPENDRELLLADKHSVYIDITDASYQSKLRYLAYKAKTIVEETGSNNLYLAFGMLNWRFNDRDLRSPLILVPVTLTTTNRGQRYVLTIDEAGASTPNYCLVEKLRVSFGLEIPGLANPTEDDSGIDLELSFNAVREAVAKAGLSFRVEETVHLSILQFAKFPLWKDLDESWAELSRNSLVTHLINSPNEKFSDPVNEPPQVDLDELGASLPMPADSSQLQAVAEAVAGRTFVLEGPPGTGKSQTITNLLAHAMVSGRRVLFVAEKRAALDVVKDRLERVGLGELSLDLHDKSARPAAVRQQIKQALELRVNHDAAALKTNLQTVESSRRVLARYADRLHETNAAGLSLYTARSSELAADQEIAPLTVPPTLVASGDPETFENLSRLFRDLPEKADLARPSQRHPWGFIDVADPGALNPSEIHAAAVEFDQALIDLLDRGVDLDQIARAGDSYEVFIWADLTTAPRYPIEGLDELHSESWKAELAAIKQRANQIAASKPSWSATVTPAAMDLDIPAIHQAAVDADNSGFFGRRKRRRAVLERLSSVLCVEAKTVKLKTLSTLTGEILETFEAVQQLRERVAKIPVAIMPDPWNPLVDEDTKKLIENLDLIDWLVATLCSEREYPYVDVLRDYYASRPSGELAEPVERLAKSWARLTKVTGVERTQQQAWADPDPFLARWWETRAARRLETTATIDRWVDLLRHVQPLRAVGMDEARADILSGKIVAEDAALAFDRGIAAASVSERFEASALNDFDVEAHSKAIKRFATGTSAVREELCRAIPAKLLGQRSFDPDAGGRIGNLRRQLDRKRGGMSVRALMENYGDLITQILPCTLMSPESVARFFPAKAELFDIVVFDEASQIRVADAIGAMGRAKSVVVVGDSKQMPPTSFAEVSATIDEEAEFDESIVPDEESILTECVKAFVPQQWLSWHYRSQDEALIAFSNYHYYENRLASFPAPLPASGSGARGHGISLVRVDGHFERKARGKSLRTNRVEAERIVEDVKQRFAQSPDKAPSLGVITFNAQQRDLIENLLRDTGDDRILQALDQPDGLFVKNLENVQGDERDTILFSVAFSADDKGVVPLNFGPLSKPGGERRLNVAITRARREVVLYASFDPSELRAEETTQLGTKHLKAYLELAARGVQTVTDGGKRQPVFDRHRDDIAEALRDTGLIVQTDVGLSDFRVDLVISSPDQPEQPLVAVLLDGPDWYGRRTVSDRDALPVEVLDRLMKWPGVERVWLPEWLHRREATIERLKKAVEEAQEKLARRAEEASDVSSAPATESPRPEPVPVSGRSAAAVEPSRGEAEAPRQFATLRSAPTATVERGETQHPLIKPYQEYRLLTPDWGDYGIAVEPDFVPAIRSLYPDEWSDDARHLRTDAQLVPEPAGSRGRWAISVRAHGKTIGYLGADQEETWSGVIRRVIASGYIPTTSCQIYAYGDFYWDDKDYLPDVRIALGDPAVALPINNPPEVPYTLLPKSSSFQVTRTEEYFDILSQYVPEGGYGVLFVTLHAGQPAGSGKPYVEVRIDGKRVGRLTPQTSQRLLPLIRHFEARGFVTVCRGNIKGSALAVELRITAIKAHEATPEVLDGPPITVPSLVPRREDPLQYDLSKLAPVLEPLPLVPPPPMLAEPGDGTVIRFYKGGGRYVYVAIRRGRYWETTSTGAWRSMKPRMNWETLGSQLPSAEVVTAWSDVKTQVDARVRQYGAVVQFTVGRHRIAAVNIDDSGDDEGDWYTTVSDDLESELRLGKFARWSEIVRYGSQVQVAVRWRSLRD